MSWALAVDGHSVAIPALFALGCGVGVIAGMFGIGGGALLVPLLHVVLGVPIKMAVGAVLCQTIASTLASLIRHRAMGHAESRLDVLLLGGVVVGVQAGVALLEALSTMGEISVAGKTMSVAQLTAGIGYVVVFSLIAAVLWHKQSAPPVDSGRPGPLARLHLPPMIYLPTANMHVSAPLMALVGCAIGVLAGMLGVGGGIILIPIMLYGLGFDIRTTAGTGILVVLVGAALGTAHHARLGNVHLGLAAVLMVGSALSAQFGASLTRRLSSVVLRRGLAVVLWATNAALIVKLLR